jgi:hypothetical protein
MKICLLLFIHFVLFAGFPFLSLFAEGSPLTTGGSIRLGGWSSSRTLDNQKDIGVPNVLLNSKYEFSENTKLVLDGWLRSERLARTSAAKGSLREAYIQSVWGDWEFIAGRKLYLWGRADGINPTDNLSPRNYTLLTPEDTDQRLGTYSLSAKVYKGDYSFQFIAIPYFVGNTVPIPKQGFPLSNKLQEVGGAQNNFAFKWERIGGVIDWSLSYFQGYDLNPDLGIRRIPRFLSGNESATFIDLAPDLTLSNPKWSESNSLQTIAKHHRIHVYGGDMSTVIGKYSLRGETAYTQTADPTGKNNFIKNPFWQTVVGGDRTFLEYLNINIQYIYKRTFFVQDLDRTIDPYEQSIARVSQTVANQLFEHLHGASLRISYKWLHETLESEITFVGYFNRGDSFVRPKIKYAINDSTYLIIGGDYYSGPSDNSFFGLLKRNSGFFTELQRNF